MPLRFESASQFEAFLSMTLDEQAAQNTINGVKRVGKVVNEVTVEEFKAGMATAALYERSLADIEKQTAALQREWWRAQRVLRATQFAFRQTTIVGTAMFAPLIALAVKYNKEITKTHEVLPRLTAEWNSASRGLQQSAMRIGRVTTELLLPYLQDVEDIANRVSRFAERHPGIIEAAMKTGIAVATVGVLGTLVTKGVQMIVDVKFVLASAQNLLAAQTMLRAAEINAGVAASNLGQAGAKSTLSKIGGAVAGGAATAGKYGGAVVGQIGLSLAYAKVFDTLYEGVSKLGPLAKLGEAATFVLERLVSQFVPFITQIRVLGNVIEFVKERLQGVQEAGPSGERGTKGVRDLSAGIEKLKKESEGAIIMLELQRDLVKMATEYEKDRLEVIRDGANEALQIQRRYVDAVSKALRTMNDNIADLTADFIKDSRRAEEDHLRGRLDIIRDSGEQIVKAEKDLQEKLRKLQFDHLQRVDELERERDALGLVKEQRRYDFERAELLREGNDRIAQIRAEVAERLREYDREFAIARQRRQEDYLERVQEERDRYEEAKKVAAERRKEETETLRKAQEEKLEALRVAYEAERSQAINAAYEKIVMLRGALIAELQMRRLYHGLILNETQDFLDEYLAILASAEQPVRTGTTSTRTPTRQLGGPINSTGTYFLHRGEHVLNPSIVSAAEKALGGTFTQQKLIGALAGGASRVYYYDHRRIDADLSPRQREEIANDVIERLTGVIR